MRVVRLLPSLWVTGLVLGPVAVAQAPRRTNPVPAASPSSQGAVVGVVYDSLLKAPLPGARVWIIGSPASAITDEGGRFRLDGVAPGRPVIAFEHDDLDSAGLSNNARRITVLAGRPTTVELAVPSLATMHRAACVGAAFSPRDSGVVFGSVEDVGTHARLAGARVTVSWVAARMGAARVEVTRPGVTVTSDSVGNFYACGIPHDYIVVVDAEAGSFGASTELLLGPRRMARRDMGISRDSAASSRDSAGLHRGRATLAGVVLDESGQPRPGMRVTVDDALSEGFTNEAGRFVVGTLPAGSRMMMVRMVGYTATRMPVLLRHGDTTRVRVQVRALTVLDTLRVTATSGREYLRFQEVEQRLRGGRAFVLRGEDVKQRPSMRAVFQGLPSLMIEGRSTYSFTMRTFSGGRLNPVTLYVDGVLATTESIQSYRPDQIFAVEWYPRGGEAPLQYQTMGNTGSGILLIWTRFMR